MYNCMGKCSIPLCPHTHVDPRDVGMEDAMNAFVQDKFNVQA